MDLQLPIPESFPAFPYSPPYGIQTDLMRHLYESIEQKKVTIVESPTGTGKTLTLLCASLSWLADEKERARKGKMKETRIYILAKDWVVEQTLERVRRELEADEQEYETRLAQARKREEIMRRAAKGRVTKRPKVGRDDDKLQKNEDEDSQFLPETDQEAEEGEIHISPALRALMAKCSSRTKSRHDPDSDGEITCTKVYYASRTHSQLAQVLPELSKLKFAANPSVTNFHPKDNAIQQQISRKRALDDLLEQDLPTSTKITRAVSLGSRKQLCINDQLRGKARDLDEACRELLGEKEGKRCEYLPPIGEEEQMLDFRDQILASPKDIEDLAAAGRLTRTCPYFGSRRAIPQAELITLPYNLLLQKSAREALGINLKDQIVLIDEAHNLIPTLLSLSSAVLPYATLSTSFQQVCAYVSRFKTRLSAVNMLHLKRLVVFLDSLKKYLEQWKKARENEKEKSEVITVAQLIEGMSRKVSGINLLEIESYLKRSKVARKIAGYADKMRENDAADPKRAIRKGAIPPLHVVEDFLLSLTNTNTDGRINLTLVNLPGKESAVEIKYQLLNPSPHFMEVVEDARSVVLAGGTMSPISDVINQLFATLAPDKITSFSCGHIIPEENLQTLVVGMGPTGAELEYKAKQQSDPVIIAQLGQILLNFANIVPAGMIIFFPSYKFLNAAKGFWTGGGMLSKFSSKKEVFFEPEDSSQVESVLQEYGAAATQVDIYPKEGNKRGAMLFAVIGAKLSEGLNFADDLARGVVIVGLPFANLGSPELQERMKYVKRLEAQRGTAKKEKGQKDAAAELYENMCMNAVNQSIGRAIRHRDDWASLLLLDRRYGTTSVRNKLPKWIGNKVKITESFGQTVKEMGTFFRNKKS
ncbi:hypothetical protein HYPSUDRAFT_146538 [Hypholoma sublateritium FD-334 SS-4]|uniref:ATP-dependent DNA helicase CHL1 n=1 Tax=Hypholoma sublateritium (strain FD-334 SS-4) TaxID=945553 RepID=A0A0D2NEJ5_HYPSF|nr:hypothetical protein HYPSUDRAFT_146538 [Hypholoma sublateritium FD-334 SS-4]